MSAREADARRTRGVRSAWLGAAALVLLCAPLGGCFGYLMGWTDAEVESLRRVVSELEAKNSELLEECMSLRERLEKLDRGRGPVSGGGPSGGGAAAPAGPRRPTVGSAPAGRDVTGGT